MPHRLLKPNYTKKQTIPKYITCTKNQTILYQNITYSPHHPAFPPQLPEKPAGMAGKSRGGGRGSLSCEAAFSEVRPDLGKSASKSMGRRRAVRARSRGLAEEKASDFSVACPVPMLFGADLP